MRNLVLSIVLLATPALADLPADCRATPTRDCLLAEAQVIITTLPADQRAVLLWLDLAFAQWSDGQDPTAALAAAKTTASQLTDPEDIATATQRTISTLARIRQFDAAFDLLATLPVDQGTTQDVAYTQQYISSELARAGMWTDAQTLALSIANPSARNGALERLAAEHVATDDIAAAQKTISLMDYPDPFFTDRAAATIAAGQARLGDVAAALATVAAIPTPGPQVEGRIAVALALFDTGQTAASDLMFADVTAQLTFLPSGVEQNRAALTLTRALLKTGALEQAQAVYGQYPVQSADTFQTNLLQATARAGQTADAMALLATFGDAADRPWPTLYVVLGFAEGGNTDSALTLALTLPQPSARAAALLDIAGTLP